MCLPPVIKYGDHSRMNDKDKKVSCKNYQNQNLVLPCTQRFGVYNTRKIFVYTDNSHNTRFWFGKQTNYYSKGNIPTRNSQKHFMQLQSSY